MAGWIGSDWIGLEGGLGRRVWGWIGMRGYRGVGKRVLGRRGGGEMVACCLFVNDDRGGLDWEGLMEWDWGVVFYLVVGSWLEVALTLVRVRVRVLVLVVGVVRGERWVGW